MSVASRSRRSKPDSGGRGQRAWGSRGRGSLVPIFRSLMLSAHSKKVLQSKLNQPRRHRGSSDDAEVCGPKVGSGIGELRMVQSVVELHAESELCIFAKAADCSGFAEREIGIELSRAVHDALT